MAQRRATGTWRVWLPAFVFGCAALAACVRLVYLQVLQHDHYSEKAKAALEESLPLLSRRGSILDRNGNVLATSVDTWDIYVSARAWSDPAKAAEAAATLAPYLGQDAATLLDKVSGIDTGDVLVQRDVDYETGTSLQARRIPGVITSPNTDRVHPEGDLAAPIVGFIGADNSGLAGLEYSYDEVLQGKPGRVLYERDTTGDPIPYGLYVVSDPVPGRTIVTTIDRYLQQLTERVLAEAVEKHRASGGSIIVMDPSTGDILAMATMPGYKYSAEIEDNDLLRNRAVSDLYEPGSVMKVVTAAAAIDAGVVTPDTTYYDSGEFVLYDATIKNWNNNAYGTQSMTGVLQYSINTGAIYMQRALGTERFLQYLDLFGFNAQTGIDLAGEAVGIMRRPGDEHWTVVDPATQSFGQSISVTPLQMVSAIAAVINGGKLVTPRVVSAYIDVDGQRTDIPVEVRGQPITAETSAKLRSMLQQVLNPPNGTHPGNPKLYTAGGKSGTANVPVTNGYNDRQIASFIGFAPVEDPKILILVKIDDNADLKTGTEAAGPVFSELADDILTYLNVQPDAARFVEAR